MKEVMAIVRQSKVNITKEALAEAGVPAFTCRRVVGRGKRLINMNLLKAFVEEGQIPMTPVGEYMSEITRLIPKRVFTMIVEDEEVDKVIEVIMEANSTENPGDGKIFILPVYENYQVRNGASTIEAY